jgi:hypothetical protein
MGVRVDGALGLMVAGLIGVPGRLSGNLRIAFLVEDVILVDF